LEKAEVRALARDLNLETWDKPAAACLASRLAYGVSVSEQALTRIERAEESLRLLGLAGDVRVRDQGHDLARIEVSSDRFDHVMTHRVGIVDAMHEAGFRYVTLDLEGFRSGSHNLALSVKPRVPEEPLDPNPAGHDAYRSVARRNSSRSPGSSS
jgi:pyridinium-3,5-biscarboxylic acid mononucleotide sulfurtransferase